jgi:DNA polymerase III delta prime subunit
MFKLTLSVSKAQPKNKTEGLTVIEFLKKEFDVTKASDLKELFTTRLYSTNHWKDGKCSKRNYLGMYGITVDIDNGFTVNAARELFKEYNFIIHTSTSHRANNDKKGGVQDRFRIILPADPTKYTAFDEVTRAQALYATIIKKYPYVDTQCAEPARKYFPFLNAEYPHLFELHINDTGKYFAISEEEIAATLKASPELNVAKRKVSSMGDPNRKYIHRDTTLLLTDKVTKKRIDEFAELTPVFCPFCNDVNSVSASGYITFTRDGYPMLICDGCLHDTGGADGKYYLPLEEQYNNIFYIGRDLYHVKASDKLVTVDKLPDAYLGSLSVEDSKGLKHWLAHNRAFTSEEFVMQKMVDGFAERIVWYFEEDTGRLTIKVPPIPVKEKDNDFINQWLEELFAEHAEFVKNWLALYCYTNYLNMPVLVFSGPRGSGKSTFAEFIAKLFYGVSMDWKGESENFTDYNEKRLLIIDEAIVDKKEQYTRFKAITGQEFLSVNKKHRAKYQVRNNLCLVLLTNEDSPMYLVAHERPKQESDNQFFMYRIERSSLIINAGIREQLADRAGHYIRTELRDRYEAWERNKVGATNRYSLPTPLTTFMDEEFKNARTSLDYECDLLYMACTTGITVRDKNNIAVDSFGPFSLVNTSELKQVIDALKLKHNNVKSFRERMHSLGYLKKQKLTKNGLDAWEINPAGLAKIQQQRGN